MTSGWTGTALATWDSVSRRDTDRHTSVDARYAEDEIGCFACEGADDEVERLHLILWWCFFCTGSLRNKDTTYIMGKRT